MITNVRDLMTIDLPEGSHGDVRIEHFEVDEFSLDNLRLALSGRGTRPGTYTALMRRNTLWMSDTDAEKRDHMTAAFAIQKGAERVLIGGLGLGMILRVALLTESVKHVDVVEIDADVIALVGPYYQKLAEEHGKTLVIHHADLYAIKWAANTRWDVAWFDIWPELCTDDLAEMAKLRRSYSRRAGWCDCWGRDTLLRFRRIERRAGW